MNEKRSEKNYGVLALMPILAFLVIYVGCGLVFRAMGVSGPFNVMPRYTALMIAILIALFLYERKKPLSEKADIYCANAGRPGVMQLGLIVLLAGGFASSGAAMGGRDAIVNLGVTLIPGHFLAPGIFLIDRSGGSCTPEVLWRAPGLRICRGPARHFRISYTSAESTPRATPPS